MAPHTNSPLVFVMNASAGRVNPADIVARATKILAQEPCVFHAPTTPAELISVVARLTPKNCRTLILFGGDGTLNRVIAELAGKKFPTYLFPAGTANDLATHLGCTPEWGALDRALKRRVTRQLDIIKVNNEHFMTIGGVGVGSILTRNLNSARDRSPLFKKIAKVAGSQIYTLLAAKTIFTTKEYIHNVRLSFPDSSLSTVEIKASNIFICNQPALGKDMLVSAAARNDDGLFEVLVLKSTDSRALLISLASFKLGSEPPEAARYQAARMVIEDLDNRSMSVFGDGENLLESTRLEVQILAKSFLALVP